MMTAGGKQIGSGNREGQGGLCRRVAKNRHGGDAFDLINNLLAHNQIRRFPLGRGRRFRLGNIEKMQRLRLLYGKSGGMFLQTHTGTPAAAKVVASNVEQVSMTRGYNPVCVGFSTGA
ncbi:MAG: hypothetical protein KDA71_09360 [Planctomycetales bacterium]|nr:hypothetical protein [Planctomycetales bacterium]